MNYESDEGLYHYFNTKNNSKQLRQKTSRPKKRMLSEVENQNNFNKLNSPYTVNTANTAFTNPNINDILNKKSIGLNIDNCYSMKNTIDYITNKKYDDQSNINNNIDKIFNNKDIIEAVNNLELERLDERYDEIYDSSHEDKDIENAFKEFFSSDEQSNNVNKKEDIGIKEPNKLIKIEETEEINENININIVNNSDANNDVKNEYNTSNILNESLAQLDKEINLQSLSIIEEEYDVSKLNANPNVNINNNNNTSNVNNYQNYHYKPNNNPIKHERNLLGDIKASRNKTASKQSLLAEYNNILKYSNQFTQSDIISGSLATKMYLKANDNVDKRNYYFPDLTENFKFEKINHSQYPKENSLINGPKYLCSLIIQYLKLAETINNMEKPSLKMIRYYATIKIILSQFLQCSLAVMKTNIDSVRYLYFIFILYYLCCYYY